MEAFRSRLAALLLESELETTRLCMFLWASPRNPQEERKYKIISQRDRWNKNIVLKRKTTNISNDNKQLTTVPIGNMPKILKQILPSMSPLHKMLYLWCEEFDSSWKESSISSMKPLSPGTSPGILGTLGGGGKNREVRSS